jgi:hypothetical protein
VNSQRVLRVESEFAQLTSISALRDEHHWCFGIIIKISYLSCKEKVNLNSITGKWMFSMWVISESLREHDLPHNRQLK